MKNYSKLIQLKKGENKRKLFMRISVSQNLNKIFPKVISKKKLKTYITSTLKSFFCKSQDLENSLY